jgi:SAM-dependent methyltransferase
MDEATLREALTKYNFYHIIPLTPELSTPGVVFPNEEVSERALGCVDLVGKRVLDVGCRDGKFSFEAERRGASEVIGIDNDLSKAATELLIPYFKSGVQMHEMNLLDLRPDTFGSFDVVLFFGVLYHLRYPFWALKLLRDVLVPGGLVLIETAVMRDSNAHAMLYCPIGADSPYEDTSCTYFNEKGLRDSLQSLGLHVERVEHLHPSAEEPPTARVRRRLREVVRVALGHSGPPPMPIGRATFVARFDPTLIDRDVTEYWEGIHTLESPGKRAAPWVRSSNKLFTGSA